MPHEKQKKESLKWFQHAVEDLRFAKYGLEANPPFLKGSTFHAQQCAEKSIKGYLVFHGKRVPRTHDLRGLAELVFEINPSLDGKIENIGDLTKYITASRYPTELEFTNDLVQQAISIASLVYEILYREISE
ncbi:MAG: HEPN domain-containing protein [Bdellovibrionales bacterium]|nr:HEPN domain-containing protein [Bdellovibrionales bacterium]